MKETMRLPGGVIKVTKHTKLGTTKVKYIKAKARK